MSTEQTYPLYRIAIKWEQDGEHDARWPESHEGLPEGRIWNSTRLHTMYREGQDVSDLERSFRDEWWPKYVAEKLADKNPSEPTITVTEDGRETWCLSWFEHWTFDVGQSDEEALASFERYVRRYERMQDVRPGEYPEGYRCLMGAEDRWRWNGGPGPDERTPPPCRCKHCKAQGKIRIGH